MPDLPEDTTRLIRRLREGDMRARDGLVEHACRRLRRLASQMLKGYPGVRRWEETDDVVQNAMVRLDRALSQVTPESVRHFWNLATLQIRRELLDLADRYRRLGAHHHTDGGGKAADDPGGVLHAQPDKGGEPESPEEWAVVHESVQELPQEEREVVDLLWYQGLTQEQAKDVLGVSLRTVKRRWQGARLSLGWRLRRGRPD